MALTVVIVVLLAAPAGAAPTLRVNERNVDYPRVNVTVTVPEQLSDSRVPASAFALTEAGRDVDFTVEPLASDQLDLVLLMDTSGSMRGKAMTAAKRAAEQFVSTLPDNVRVSVVGFGTVPRVVTPFSTDHDRHRSAIRQLEATGQTALHDAIAAAAAQFTDAGKRRTIVLLSDGGDTASTKGIGAASAALERADATVYAVQLVTSESDKAALSTLARNGRVVPATNPTALAAVYAAIAQELVSQYRVSWVSGAHGTTPVRVSVAHDGIQAAALTTMRLPAAPPPPAVEPDPVPAPPQPVAGTVAAEPGIFADPRVVIAGGVLFFVGMTLLLLQLLATRRRPMSSLGRTRGDGAGLQRGLSELAEHAVLLADRSLRKGQAGTLNAALERGGINLRPGEFLVMAACAVLTALAVGFLLGGTLIGLLLAVAAAVAAKLFVSVRGERRRRLFADQLHETLQLISGSLRAGYGLLQAVDAVAREAASPTAEEFRRLIVETRLGREFTSSLNAMAARLRNEDFEWVVQAITIHREVGGDLAEVLDAVAHTIRDRNQLRRQVKALSAEGKLSGIVLCIIPPAVGALIAFINPGYLTPLVTTGYGIVASAMGLALMILGVFWMRRVVRLVF